MLTKNNQYIGVMTEPLPTDFFINLIQNWRMQIFRTKLVKFTVDIKFDGKKNQGQAFFYHELFTVIFQKKKILNLPKRQH